MADVSERAPRPVAHEATAYGGGAADAGGPPTGTIGLPADTDAPAEEPRAKARGGSGWWEIAETLLVALLLFFGMRQIIPSVEVDGLSMVPSLSNHQRLLVNRLAYTWFDVGGEQRHLFGTPQRGDIVVINPPPRPIESFWDSFRNQFAARSPRDEPYIKRIVGLPGDRIRVADGRVYINGTPIAEDYIKDPPNYTYPPPGATSALPLAPDGALVLGADQYFVLGDNRNASSDSHYFGPITSDRIIGKAWVSIWPWEEIGFLPHKTYPNIPVGN